jgi:kumamolisin
VADSAMLDVDVVLAPSNTKALGSLLHDMYDARSARFHRWLTPGQFDTEFGPSAGTRAAVASWLQARGLVAETNGFDMRVHARADALAHAFGITIGRYRTRDGRTAYSADQTPQLLSSIANDVNAIVGLDDDIAARPSIDTRPLASVPSAVTPNADGLTPCAGATNEANHGFWTPDQVGSLYGVGSLLGAGQNGTGQKIAVFELSPHTSADTSAYLSCFGLTNTVTTTKVDGGGSTSGIGTLEANIDIEEAATQATHASIVSYEGPNTDTGLYDTYHRIVSDDTASVISTSWGLCEPDEAKQTTSTFAALDTLFAQAATQGQAVLAATGDSGSEDCWSADVLTSLQVDSPADDPHVTAVGGTSLLAANNEPVWNDCEGEPSLSHCETDLGSTPGGAGGGLSSHFTRPAWQPAVSGGTCSLSSCRAVPDVSANAGIGEVFESGGSWTAVGGTSIAAPKIAGIIADVDTACQARIGDVAPALDALQQLGVYSTALNDITTGDNDLTRSHSGKFAATAGIDLASGVGSPIAGGWSCPNITSLGTTSGTTGSQVTVNGIGLEKATFTFGGTAASVVSANATSATVVVPSGSGTVTVQASDPFGTGVQTASFTHTDSTPTSTTTTTVPSSSTTTSSSTTSSTVSSTSTSSSSSSTSTTTTTIKPPPPPPPPPNTTKYRMVGSDGGIFDFGGAPFYGSTGGAKLNQPIVGMANDPKTGGYWFVARDGGIFAYHAPFEGSTGGAPPAAPIVGMTATPTGNGYWLVTSAGEVFPFGDAGHFGSVAKPHAPIVGIASTVDGHGYWLAGSDGSVYPFGNAPNYGSEFGVRLAKPVVGISVDVATNGYWMVASDGGIFAFHAAYLGSEGGQKLNQPIVGITTTGDGKGYWMVARDGGIFTFGDAKFRGSMGGVPLNKPIVGMAAMN